MDNSLPNLTSLNLDATTVTNAGVKQLQKLNKLTTLDLGRTRITDGSVADLTELKNLTFLDCSYTQITEAGLERFRGSLPNANIRRRSQ